MLICSFLFSSSSNLNYCCGQMNEWYGMRYTSFINEIIHEHTASYIPLYTVTFLHPKPRLFSLWTAKQYTQDLEKSASFSLKKCQFLFCCSLPHQNHVLQGEAKHPGMEMLYEYHSNQSGDPDNVLMHALGHWRLTKHFHDIVFLPQVLVMELFSLFCVTWISWCFL